MSKGRGTATAEALARPRPRSVDFELLLRLAARVRVPVLRWTGTEFQLFEPPEITLADVVGRLRESLGTPAPTRRRI
jgi:hypothetical protein